MAPARWLASTRRALLSATLGVGTLALLLAASSAHAIKVVTWNMLQYPESGLAARQPEFRTVMASIGADLIFVQEMNSTAGRDSFLTNVLNVVEPGQWAASDWIQLQPSPVEGGAVFYKPSKVTVTNVTSFSSGGPRAVLQGWVQPVGYVSLKGGLQLDSIHLRATKPDSAARRQECTEIRKQLNYLPAGTNFLLGGDSNFYGSWEGGYIRLTESQSNNNGRSRDPLVLTGDWHDIGGYAIYHTQSACKNGCPGYFSGGGLDDRFDLIMSSYSLADGNGVDIVPGTVYAYGQDGQHFNTDVNDGVNLVVPASVADALHNASDHLPVVMTLQVAAKLTTDPSLAFGTVIVGATASQNLAVSNPATTPADALSYSFAAPTGFTAPTGSFELAAGAPAASHAIGMNTASAGNKSGNLTIATDAPDNLTKLVALSGKVLNHAQASLDSTTSVLKDTLDFGEHTPGGFADLPVRLHNRGYNTLRARLAVSGGSFNASNRFSIDGGFAPATLAGVGQTYSIHFNDLGAPVDSTYRDTLTFTSADEPLPGAQPQPDLVVELRARVLRVGPGVPGVELPSALRFYPPRPNPLSRSAVFGFDLPRGANVSLEVYDLSGRRVATLASGGSEAGHHEVRWDAANERGGRVPAGLYFVRFETPGMRRVGRLVVLP